MHLHQKTQTIEECIRACRSCHEICVETADHGVGAGGEHAETEHMRLLLDCYEICQVSLNSMVRSSAASIELCRSCAEICDRCAVACERFTGDPQMQACARECRRCAQACRQMVSSAAGTFGQHATTMHPR